MVFIQLETENAIIQAMQTQDLVKMDALMAQSSEFKSFLFVLHIWLETDALASELVAQVIRTIQCVRWYTNN